MKMTIKNILPVMLLLGFGATGNGATSQYEKDFPNFACDVDTGPLTESESAQITSSTLTSMAKKGNGTELLDRLYARLTSGPMPMGFYQGKIHLGGGEAGDTIKNLFASLGMPKIVSNTSILTAIGQKIWRGKYFKPNPFDVPQQPTRILANKMPVTNLKTLFKLFKIKAPDAVPNQWRFPAKVFCGQSKIDSRRESIIIDYAHTESVFDTDENSETKIQYVPAVDFLGGRKGLGIRDEIRMVRPGFYLGKAYMGGVFVLHFSLECESGECKEVMAGNNADACNIGTQRTQQFSGGECISMGKFRQ
jgi:hypothetical protein